VTLLVRLFAFALGAIFGSFLNVCILRWPRERSIVRPRSRCPHCGNQLQWFENIPIFSWIALRGRCRCCDEWISVQYPLVELLVAMGWVLAVNTYGPTLTAFRVAAFGTLLLGVAVTDLRDYLIPDGFTLTGLVFALVMAAVAYVRGDASPFATPYEAIIGACAGAGMIAIVGWVGEIATGKEAMGLGDVTLMAFVGAALGPQRALITVFLGAMRGSAPWLGIVFVALLGIAFIGIAGALFPMLHGDVSASASDVRGERTLTLAPPVMLAFLVVVLGLYVPASLDTLLRHAAAALGG